MSVIAIPFNRDRIRNEGASSSEEFRDWIVKHGESFLHSISNPQTGDVLVFGWMKEQGEWIFVGDTVVKQNHMSGSVDWCNCTKEDKADYKRHIITGGVRVYPTSVSSKSVPSIKLLAFAQISPEDYLKLIASSVSHWQK